ncbi:S1C family serine protease [Granulicatella elegans]|uniref:S1C family serine protease n=1 Tax=Granulicatella elegans TaxID=137732 RepID=UPI001D13D848|nr:trypsin-like peptidase domain-containing protein [Granulicatella elegans]UEA31986.1 trypsin-like peptidase domain-containing protein [Granulicatella elegans]
MTNEFHEEVETTQENIVLNEEITPEPTPVEKKSAKKKKVFRSGFVGGVTGGLLAVIIGFGAMSATGTLNQLTGAKSTVSSTTTVKTSPTALSNKGAGDVSDVVANVKNAVVSVINKQSLNQNSLFGNYGQSRRQNQKAEDSDLTTASEGSGVIYKVENGYAYIVTNNHVISGSQELEVLMADGTREKAELIGADKWTDLAVLKIKADKVTTVAEFANSDEVKAGQTAIAIGSPLGTEFATSVTQGIVSAKDRSVPTDVDGDGKQDWVVTAIQTDAAINPGNSGGALVNAAGQVIGINSMKISKTSVEGIGFAIPSNEVVSIINQLEKSGKVIRPVLGISMVDLTSVSSQGRQQLGLSNDVKEGVVVADVQDDSSASKGGLKQYDVITEIDGKPIKGVQTLRKALYSKTVGSGIEVTYYRNGQKQTKTIQLTSSDSPSL